MSDYNQLRDSLINRLKKAEPQIVRRLQEIEKMPINTRPDISKVYSEIASEVLRGFMKDTKRFWDSNEDKHRNLLADLIVNNQGFIEKSVADAYPFSIGLALTSVLKEMLEDEAYDWFYDFAYNFQQNRHNKTGGAA